MTSATRSQETGTVMGWVYPVGVPKIVQRVQQARVARLNGERFGLELLRFNNDKVPSQRPKLVVNDPSSPPLYGEEFRTALQLAYSFDDRRIG